MVVAEWMKSEYPFASNILELKDGSQYHYVDEGEGEVIVMLHGNPTWSYFYRNLIKKFSQTNRVIVPDHIGCGLSDKPQDYTYRLEQHIANVEALIEKLGVKNITLIVHDWGGAIGMGVATAHPENIKKIVLINTAAFPSEYIAPSINLCRIPVVGELMIRTFNGFAWPATFMAVEKKLPKLIKKGFLFPYNNYKNRIATAKFVTDIPMDKKHPSYETLRSIGEKLPGVKCPKLIVWGKKDFCFNDYFLNRWQEIYPDATVVPLENVGHYLLEDDFDTVSEEIAKFL